jgi:hypothetical protein
MMDWEMRARMLAGDLAAQSTALLIAAVWLGFEVEGWNVCWAVLLGACALNGLGGARIKP